MFSVTDVASVCALKLHMEYDGRLVGIGSGFLYFHKANTYLVTARHNLTRRNALTEAPLTKPGNEHLPVDYPTDINFVLPYEAENEPGKISFDKQPCTIRIWHDQNPIWRVFNPDDLAWDVAVIDLSTYVTKGIIRSTTDEDQATFLSDTRALLQTNEYAGVSNGSRVRLASITNYLEGGFELRVGDDVFVLGYPFGIDIGLGLPIWKRASIASEPAVPSDGFPMILIDTATREGMSGGLVIARQHRGTTNLPRWKLSLISGELCRLVGIYTSRNKGSDEFEAQLGRVWTQDHLIDVIENGRPDKDRL